MTFGIPKLCMQGHTCHQAIRTLERTSNCMALRIHYKLISTCIITFFHAARMQTHTMIKEYVLSLVIFPTIVICLQAIGTFKPATDRKALRRRVNQHCIRSWAGA